MGSKPVAMVLLFCHCERSVAIADYTSSPCIVPIAIGSDCFVPRIDNLFLLLRLQHHRRSLQTFG